MRFTLIAFFLLLIWQPLPAQEEWLDELSECYFQDQPGCMEIVNAQLEARREELSLEEYSEWLRKSCSALANIGIFDVAITLEEENIRVIKESDTSKLGKAYKQMGTYYLYLASLDTALIYYTKSLDFYTSTNDSLNMGISWVNMGQVSKELGNYTEALKYYTTAITIFRAVNNERFEARTYAEMASLSAMTGDTETAIAYNKIAARYYKTSDDQHTYAYIITNLANDLITDNQLDSARILLERAMPIFKQEGNVYLLMNAEAQYGKMLFFADQPYEAIKYFKQSNSRDPEKSYVAQLAYNAGYISEIYTGLGEFEEALKYARESYQYNKDIGFNEEYAHALNDLYNAFRESGQYDSAIYYLEQFHEVRDSLFGIEKQKQFEELEVAYGTKIKEEQLAAQQAEIELLTTRSEKVRIRNTAITIGGLLFFIIGILVFRNQRIIASKREQLHQAEITRQETENHRLQEQLDHKKRELTSQALLMAEKNELMLSFKDQLEEISSGNNEHNPSLDRLVKKIESVETKTEDWDKFMRIFEDVHPEFVRALQSNFQNTTANDLRLATLLKMNFSSKEIASILHISSDGLKKARYRLRKKLDLETDQNLEEFLASL